MYKHHIEDMAIAVGKALGILDKDKKESSSPEGAEDMGKIRKGLEAFWDKEGIAIIWTVEDVIQCANDNGLAISKYKAQEVLDKLLYDHDANIGINWDTIFYTLPPRLRKLKKNKSVKGSKKID
jgi:hypothetical protein